MWVLQSAVQEQLKSDSSRVRDQVCEVMRILTATLHQIYALFYCGDNSQEGGETLEILLKNKDKQMWKILVWVQ